MTDTPGELTRELQARCEAAVEEAIYNFLYGDDMDTARPKQFKEHFVYAILSLIESELAALRTRCEEAERERADLQRQLEAARAEKEHKQTWIDNMREAWRNHGKESSLYDWNERMKRAVEYPDHLPTEALTTAPREGT